MRRFVRLAACAALFVVTGCGGSHRPPNLSLYRTVVTESIFAWAWGGAAGYQKEDQFDVRVVFEPRPDADHYHLFACDPAESSCESLAQFGDLGLKPRMIEGGMLGEFRTKIDEQDRRLVVTAERGTELLTSQTLVTTVGSRPTRYFKDALRYDRAQAQLSWTRLPDEASFVVLVNESEDEDEAAGVATRRKTWTYPELQGILRHFHDPAKVPQLQRGGRYDVVLFAINQQGWATAIADLRFNP